MSDGQNVGFSFNVSTGADAAIFAVNQLSDVFGIVKAKLQQAATNDGLFAQVFGDKANTAEFQAIRHSWAIGDFSQLPSVQVISAADMNGADGAYASSTQKIYLSDSLFQSSAAPVDSVLGVAGVLTEETFHWLDDRVGTDTQGDEGEFAKDLLFGVKLRDSELARIKKEDDTGSVFSSGIEVKVEQALPDLRQYWFYYNYNGSNYLSADSYRGSVVAPAGKYQAGQTYFNSSNNENGTRGAYYINTITDYADSKTADNGKVWVEEYIDRDNGGEKKLSTAKYRNNTTSAGTNYLGSEEDYIVVNGISQNENLRFGKGWFEADPIADLKQYWFYYNYNGSNYLAADSYRGSVVAPDGKYQAGQTYFDSSNNENGTKGAYYINSVTDYVDSKTADNGKVWVEEYIDRDNGGEKKLGTTKYRNNTTPAGTNYLGSEEDYIVVNGINQNENLRFGKGWFEADPTSPFVNVPTGNWKAEYFNNVGRSGSPVLVQDLGGGNQNFFRDWGIGSPGAGVNVDNFSARVTTQRYFAAGLHQIESTSDDGVLVTINGTNVIDKMVDQSTTNKGVFNAGNGGTFSVVIDYYERGGGAKLSFSSSLLSSSAYRLSQLLSKSTPLTIQEINESRNLIAQNSSQTERENLYSQLQYKTPYFNQRDNLSSGSIADVMCNVTTLANCLTFLGITNPNSNKQFEDALEDILRKDPKKYPSTDGINARYWWSNLSKLATSLGATSSGVQMLKGFPATDVQFFQTFVRNNWEPALKSGKAVMTSVATTSAGHIVRVIGVDWQRGGLIIDDPFGSAQDTAGSDYKRNNYVRSGIPDTRNTSARGNINTQNGQDESGRGKQNFWSWSYCAEVFGGNAYLMLGK